MDETLATLTADIISAHAANNNVAAAELSGLIGRCMDGRDELTAMAFKFTGHDDAGPDDSKFEEFEDWHDSGG